MPEIFESLFLFGGPVALIIQILLCVHVYKTGRPYWWMWLIMGGSLIGCLLYAILELLPEARSTGVRGVNVSWLIPKSLVIKKSLAVLEESDTVENRLAVAALYFDNGQEREAEKMASECATGVFKDDPHVLSEVAWYKLAVGKVDEAHGLLMRIDVERDRTLAKQVELLGARVLFAKGEHRLALASLEELANLNLGEEPRYYAALCYYALQDKARALALFDDIQKKYRKSGKIWRRSEKPWFLHARDNAKAIRANKAIEVTPGAVKEPAGQA